MAFWGRFFWTPVHPHRIWQFLTSSYSFSILYHILICYLLTNCKLWIIGYGGKFLILIREIKIPPYLCDNAITWCVNCCWNIVIDNCMICEFCGLLKRRRRYKLCDLFMKYADWLHGMWFVVLNAIFIHFYQLHP